MGLEEDFLLADADDEKTILFFKNGEVVDKQVGAVGKPVFVEKVKKLL